VVSRLALVIAALCAVVVIGAIALLVARRDAEAPRSAPAAGAASAVAPSAGAAASPSPADAAAPAPLPGPAPVAPPGPAAVPELGTLRIESDVEGASVFLDRRYLGEAPVTAEAIPPGPHQVNVSAQGFDGISETIDVEPGPRSLMYRLREVRLDAAVPVVHRHGVGSCRGRLVATPDGIRFEADEGEDGFSVALGAVEAFEVDYLENALRLQIRNGRRYDFRDPDGDADRLFVVHRDVEQARQRLGALP
jgi:hypothetical protein